MSVAIRNARPGDLYFIREFQINMAKETEDVLLDPNVLTRGIQAVFDHPEKGQFFIAEVEGQIAGCLMTTYEWSEWRNGQVLWIQSVYVSKNFRGNGVFKSLYKHVQIIAHESKDVRGIRLYVDKSNEKAQHVYRQLGMNGDHYQVFEWMK